MAKRSQAKKDSRDIKAEALKLAAGYKVDGQSKEHSKLIANGVARGIEQFLRQQSEKTRDLDKRSKQLKKTAVELAKSAAGDQDSAALPSCAVDWRICLPWGLLLLSWGVMVAYSLR